MLSSKHLTGWGLGFLMLPYYSAGVFLVLAIYIVYYRYFHPLSKYPGPFLASFSNLWKAYHLYKLRMPEDLQQLHGVYGDVVRVGPNDLSFSSPQAVGPIYKAGRSLPKTGFYDGFTTFNPNLFGTTDEKVRSKLSPAPLSSDLYVVLIISRSMLYAGARFRIPSLPSRSVEWNHTSINISGFSELTLITMRKQTTFSI